MQVHHLRSTDLKHEKNYLIKCWNTCLKKRNTLVPAYKIVEKDMLTSECPILETIMYYQTKQK